MEVARRLTATTGAPRVVFCTAYDQYALPAFETAAVDYLMKPVRAERLAMALDRVRAGLQMAAAATPQVPGRAPRRQLCVRRRGSLRLIPVEDIRYLQADEKYVVIHHAKGEDLLEVAPVAGGGVRRALRAHPPQLPDRPRPAGRVAARR
jgi:two-component system response regulator AlgR